MENTGFLGKGEEDRLVNDRVVIALNTIGEYKQNISFLLKTLFR